MSRRTLERRRLAEERWPQLANILACHFNQDFDILYGSLAGAFSAAARDGSLEYRRAVLREWRDWNNSEGAVNDIRPFLDDGFAIALLFKTPLDARHFMNRFYDEVLVSVKAETRRSS